MRQQRLREHITMLGRHYATGHPSVRSGSSGAGADAETMAAVNECLEFAAWYENNIIELMVLGEPNEVMLMTDTYWWVNTNLYSTDRQASATRHFQDLSRQIKQATKRLKKDLKASMRNYKNLKSRLDGGGGAVASSGTFGTNVIPGSAVVFCPSCGKVIEDLTKAKQCKQCKQPVHEDCIKYYHGGLCKDCYRRKGIRKANKDTVIGLIIFFILAAFNIIIGVALPNPPNLYGGIAAAILAIPIALIIRAANLPKD